MSKVPVGASIAHAYEFLFGRFFQIIGTAWVPALLYGLGYFVFLAALQFPKPMPAPSGAALAAMAVPMLAGIVYFLAIRSVLGISLTQEALGVRKDLTLAHFVIGPRELRLFFAYLRYYIVFLVLYVALLAVCVGGLFLAGKFGAGLLPALAVGGKPIAVFVAAILVIVLAVWFVLSMLRLIFLLPPIASAEHRVRLSRAWALTRGSGLRILVVLIGTFLPAMIAFGVAFYYLIGPADVSALFQAFHDHKPGMPPLPAFMAAHAGMLSLLVGVSTAINSALLAGASAAAYRTVTGHEDPELEDDAALVAPLIAPAEDHSHHEEPAAGHGGHEDNGHGGHEDHGDHGHGHENHGGHEAPAEQEEHGSHDDHGHGGQDDHGHGDHGHGHEDHGGHDAHAAHGGDGGHGHAADAGHAPEDHGHEGHDDHGHHRHAEA